MEQLAGLHVSSSGPDDWRPLLAHEGHWKTGHSAKAVAHSWEDVDGFPACVVDALSSAPGGAFTNPVPVAVFPEWRTGVQGRGHAPQNDVFAIGDSDNGRFALTLESKAGEPFGAKAINWRAKGGENRGTRLAHLCKVLGLSPDGVYTIRIQLLQRAASAVLEAQRFGLSRAVMIVQAFGEQGGAFNDYAAFARLLGVAPVESALQAANIPADVRLFIGWVRGDDCYLSR